MADIRPVTPDFAVAPQLSPADMEAVARMGYRLVINNRPDGESADQPTAEEVEAAARAAGLDYIWAPFAGRPSPEQAQAICNAAAAAGGPAIAFCRSGTRSITAWALGRLLAGDPRAALVEAGRGAGYDLSQSLP